MPDLNFDDDQDQSELFDEDNFDPSSDGLDRHQRRTFEETPEVLDLTRADGDADDDEALIGEELDDDEIIEIELEQADADLDEDLEMEEASAALEETSGRFGGGDEVELIDAGDLNNVNVRRQRDLSALEASSLSDDDLEALGYAERGEDGQVRAKN